MAGLPSFGEGFSEAFNTTYGNISKAKREKEASKRADRTLAIAEEQNTRQGKEFARRETDWKRADDYATAMEGLIKSAIPGAQIDPALLSAPSSQPNAASAAAVGLPAQPATAPQPAPAAPQPAAGMPAGAAPKMPAAQAKPTAATPAAAAGMPAAAVETQASTPTNAPAAAQVAPLAGQIETPNQPPAPKTLADMPVLDQLPSSATLGQMTLLAFKFQRPEAMQLWEKYTQMRSTEIQTDIMIAAQGGDTKFQEWADRTLQDGLKMEIRPVEGQRGLKSYSYGGVVVTARNSIEAGAKMAAMVAKDPRRVVELDLQYNQDQRAQLGLEADIAFKRESLDLDRARLAETRRANRAAEGRARAEAFPWSKGASIKYGPENETVTVFNPTQPGLPTLYQGRNFGGRPVGSGYYDDWPTYDQAMRKYGVGIDVDRNTGKPFFVKGTGENALRYESVDELEEAIPKPSRTRNSGMPITDAQRGALGAAATSAYSSPWSFNSSR